MQAVAKVAVEQEPGLRGDVVGEEQSLASELEREGGSVDPAREGNSARPGIVVARSRSGPASRGTSTSGRLVSATTQFGERGGKFPK